MRGRRQFAPGEQCRRGDCICPSLQTYLGDCYHTPMLGASTQGGTLSSWGLLPGRHQVYQLLRTPVRELSRVSF